MSHSCSYGSFIYFGFIGPTEDIVDGYVVIVGKTGKKLIVCFASAVFISADTVLVKVKVKRNF